MIYNYFFQILNVKKIEWEWVYAEKKGQHYIHQMSNEIASRNGYTWVWRCDDDAIPEANVLENLYRYTTPDIGAIGGSILTPPYFPNTFDTKCDIDHINDEPNIQWNYIDKCKQVEHLHCSFLYRAGVYDYNLGLSRVAHREETLFTWGLHKRGYKVLAVPNAVTWHMKNPEGGIRSETKEEMYAHDETIFRNFVCYRNYNIVVLNCGLGDHIVFSRILSDIPNPAVFTCYPEVIPGKSIAEAQALFGSIDQWNIYKKMDQWGWKNSLEDAFRKLYL